MSTQLAIVLVACLVSVVLAGLIGWWLKKRAEKMPDPELRTYYEAGEGAGGAEAEGAEAGAEGAEPEAAEAADEELAAASEEAPVAESEETSDTDDGPTVPVVIDPETGRKQYVTGSMSMAGLHRPGGMR